MDSWFYPLSQGTVLFCHCDFTLESKTYMMMMMNDSAIIGATISFSSWASFNCYSPHVHENLSLIGSPELTFYDTFHHVLVNFLSITSHDFPFQVPKIEKAFELTSFWTRRHSCEHAISQTKSLSLNFKCFTIFRNLAKQLSLAPSHLCPSNKISLTLIFVYIASSDRLI